MIDTAQFVAWLESLEDTSGLSEVMQVKFDEAAFTEAISGSTRLQLVKSFDGFVSTVRDDADATDKSRQSRSFDLHTDGCYYRTPPELVILYCVDPGITGATTVLGDSVAAIAEVSEVTPILRTLDFVYIGKSLAETGRPLIEPHPGTCEPVTNIATRGYVRPRVTAATLPDVPDVKDIVSALGRLYAAIDANVILTHRWTRHDLLIFDNHRYLHGRRSAGYDPVRTLSRLWLSPIRSVAVRESATG